jgi:hypothetical protein
MMKSLILSLLLIAQSAFGADVCPTNVTPIDKGELAPCSGFLFSNAQEEESYKDHQLVTLEKTENDILNQRLQLYMNEANTLSKAQASRDSTETFIRLAYFLAGVIGTGLVVRNVRP